MFSKKSYNHYLDFLSFFFFFFYLSLKTVVQSYMWANNTAQKVKSTIKDFFSKSEQRIWSHLLKKSLMENFILCAV